MYRFWKRQGEREELYPNGIKFIHDNLLAHKAAETDLAEIGFDMVSFPSFSPDLSPIGNIWRSLKTRVSGEETQLRKSLERHREIITMPENLRPYFEGLSDRYRECIQKKNERLPFRFTFDCFYNL